MPSSKDDREARGHENALAARSRRPSRRAVNHTKIAMNASVRTMMSRLIANIRLSFGRLRRKRAKRGAEAAHGAAPSRARRRPPLRTRRSSSRRDALHAPAEAEHQHHVEHDVGDVQHEPSRAARSVRAEPDQPAEQRIVCERGGRRPDRGCRNSRARAPRPRRSRRAARTRSRGSAIAARRAPAPMAPAIKSRPRLAATSSRRRRRSLAP